jgi:hypothetical protein
VFENPYQMPKHDQSKFDELTLERSRFRKVLKRRFEVFSIALSWCLASPFWCAYIFVSAEEFVGNHISILFCGNLINLDLDQACVLII